MKQFLLFLSSLLICLGLEAQEYMIVTTVESIVPAGIGRSRMIVQNEDINVDDFTTSRTDGKKSNQKEVNRSDAKIKNFDETKLLNFYSVTGINFQNVASNDALITSKINGLVDLANAESDHAANTFLQWFVAEQVEEEATALGIRMELASLSRGLFL